MEGIHAGLSRSAPSHWRRGAGTLGCGSGLRRDIPSSIAFEEILDAALEIIEHVESIPGHGLAGPAE
ncbi:hypothetical protein [Novosphingobium sp. BW1]|uniref:hypothetical protein n=1 Tax=Novosphingobium sp. BW1 TaxID=2592621 RepID=UPI001396A5AA|nr:hypothetical protein [Novosphingobium sp. BW1]